MRFTFLTTVFFFALAMTTSPGCVCRKDEPPEPPQPPTDVSPGALVRVYRDTPDLAEQTFTGRRIRVTIQKGGWKETAGGIGWHTGVPGAPPVVVFLCTPPPAGSSVEIIGTCRGKTFDGHRRGPGIDWYLTVGDCSVVPLP